MDNIISRFIYEQNNELLKRIANDRFSTVEERDDFVKKYYKKNYSYVNTIKKDNQEIYNRKNERVMR